MVYLSTHLPYRIQNWAFGQSQCHLALIQSEDQSIHRTHETVNQPTTIFVFNLEVYMLWLKMDKVPSWIEDNKVSYIKGLSSDAQVILFWEHIGYFVVRIMPTGLQWPEEDKFTWAPTKMTVVNNVANFVDIEIYYH